MKSEWGPCWEANRKNAQEIVSWRIGVIKYLLLFYHYRKSNLERKKIKVIMDKEFFNAIIVSAGREMFNWVPKAHLSSEYHTEEITPRSALGLHSWSYLNTVYHIQVSSYNPLLLCTHPRKLWQFTDLSDNQNINLIMASPLAISFQVKFVEASFN